MHDDTRQRTRIRFPVIVGVSNFGNLATCWAGQDSLSPDTLMVPAPPLHLDDRARVEEALIDLGYRFVPHDIVQTRYDGPNQGSSAIKTKRGSADTLAEL